MLMVVCFSVFLFFEMVPQSSPQDTYQALQRAIGAMEEKGMQNDPRYSQLLALRARQVSYGSPAQADPSRVMQVYKAHQVQPTKRSI
jgi:hypothetical protein